MTAYDPDVHRTVVAANGESSRKFYSVNKLLMDMGAAGMIDLRVQDVEPSEQGAIWLDISQPEQSNGVPKIYLGAAWVPLTPQLFYRHIAGGGGDLLAANNLSDLANAATARVNLGVRDVLAANRTYYVRTDGSDSNNGLANTSGGAFLTIQKALDVVGSLDIGIYNVVISVGAGTFSKTGTNVLKAPLGSGTVTIQGAGMANTTVSHTSGECFYGEYTNFRFTVRDMKLQTTTSGSCLYQFGNGLINYRDVDFGSAVTAQVSIQSGGQMVQTGNCTISGGASYHILCSTNSIVNLTARTLTLSGTPAFSFAFISVVRNAFAVANSVTFSGSATGPRHLINTGGIVFTNGATEASYFPGNSSGTTTAPGAFL